MKRSSAGARIIVLSVISVITEITADTVVAVKSARAPSTVRMEARINWQRAAPERDSFFRAVSENRDPAITAAGRERPTQPIPLLHTLARRGGVTRPHSATWSQSVGD